MARRQKRGDEAYVQMLCKDARLAVGGTPAARANRKKMTGSRLRRNLIMGAVCSCGQPSVVSIPRVSNHNGATKWVDKCASCAGIAPGEIVAPPETPHEVVHRKPTVKGVGVKVFA